MFGHICDYVRYNETPMEILHIRFDVTNTRSVFNFYCWFVGFIKLLMVKETHVGKTCGHDIVSSDIPVSQNYQGPE